jgi:hypothetical protein
MGHPARSACHFVETRLLGAKKLLTLDQMANNHAAKSMK